MAPKLFDFQDSIVIGAFLMKIIPIQKTESIGNIFIRLGSLKMKIHLETRKQLNFHSWRA